MILTGKLFLVAVLFASLAGCGGSNPVKGSAASSTPAWHGKPSKLFGFGGLKKHIFVKKNDKFDEAVTATLQTLGSYKEYKDKVNRVRFFSFRVNCTERMLLGFVEPLNGEDPYVYTSNKSDWQCTGGMYDPKSEVADRQIQLFLERAADNLDKHGMSFTFKAKSHGMEKVRGKHSIYLKSWGGRKIFDMSTPPSLR